MGILYGAKCSRASAYRAAGDPQKRDGESSIPFELLNETLAEAEACRAFW